MAAGFEFERRAGERTVIQLESDGEIVLTVVETTGTKAKLQIAPTAAIKRIFKEETIQEGGGK